MASDLSTGIAALVVGLILINVLIITKKVCCSPKKPQRRPRNIRRRPQQQEQNVYSISGRVQGQEQQQRFPEAFVSVEHISIMNEMNKPPKYDDAPPSYEEAIKIAMAQNNSMETLRAEQAGVHQASSSSSVTVVQPAVPNRTTE
ncbi:uncharacterized protein LOC115884078 isoform X6 [Sitophilus oryzae]|uniref:Uncharacterized protein LOC115884078 isoform X6 n=1 Tax=Sitophilus oryzae TaxID=7048 RepID=A0A6J2Y5Z5_SITOR|nr:uncharacterized protein LOC115884078 isoform X6 [Sitophilus oryzae]